MRDIAITLAISAGLIAALYSPFFATLNLMFIWFLKPYDFGWGFWNYQPVFIIALGVLIVSIVIHGRARNAPTPIILLYLAFSAWLYLCCHMGTNTEVSLLYYRHFWVTAAPVALVLLWSIRDMRELKWVLFTMVFSLGLVASKSGFSLSLQGGGHIVDRINGFAGDNNTFAAAVILALGALIGFKGVMPKLWMRFGYNLYLLFIVLCILYTKSRGAFLSLGLLFLVGSTTSTKPVRNTFAMVALVAVGLYFLPNDLFDRMDTLKAPTEESSAANRLDYWEYAWKIGLEHPITGIGLYNFMEYCQVHFPARFQDGAQVEHSTPFQILTSTGFPGLFLYGLIMVMAFLALTRASTLVRNNREWVPDLLWVIPFAFWGRVGLIGYNFASLFVNMLLFELPWVFVWLVSLMPPMIRREISKAHRKKVPQGDLAVLPESMEEEVVEVEAKQAPAPAYMGPAFPFGDKIES